MKNSGIFVLLGIALVLLAASAGTAAAMELSISEEARSEIEKMGNVAYLSVQEIGSG